MGWLIFKVNRDPAEDRFCIWSTVVEAPIFDGTRAELEEKWSFEYGEYGMRVLPERIERAIEKGGGSEWDGDWDTTPIYMQMGALKRDKLGDLLDLCHKHYPKSPPDAEVMSLIIPFDD